MSNVVTMDGAVRPQPGDVNGALVQVLEDLIARAKSGDLQSLVGTGFQTDGSRIQFRSEPLAIDFYGMMGAIAALQIEYAALHRQEPF